MEYTLGKIVCIALFVFLGFEVGHFYYSKSKFDEIYRDGFKQGYKAGRRDKENEEYEEYIRELARQVIKESEE